MLNPQTSPQEPKERTECSSPYPERVSSPTNVTHARLASPRLNQQLFQQNIVAAESQTSTEALTPGASLRAYFAPQSLTPQDVQGIPPSDPSPLIQPIRSQELQTPNLPYKRDFAHSLSSRRSFHIDPLNKTQCSESVISTSSDDKPSCEQNDDPRSKLFSPFTSHDRGLYFHAAKRRRFG